MTMMGYEKRKILENIIESIMKRNNINLKEAATLVFSSKTYKDFVNDNINEVSSESLIKDLLLEDSLNNIPINGSLVLPSKIDVYSYISCVDGYSDYYKIPAEEVIKLYNKYDIFDVLDSSFDTLEGEYRTAQYVNEIITYKKNKK